MSGYFVVVGFALLRVLAFLAEAADFLVAGFLAATAALLTLRRCECW